MRKTVAVLLIVGASAGFGSKEGAKMSIDEDEAFVDERIYKKDLPYGAPYVVTHGAHASTGDVFFGLENVPFTEVEKDAPNYCPDMHWGHRASGHSTCDFWLVTKEEDGSQQEVKLYLRHENQEETHRGMWVEGDGTVLEYKVKMGAPDGLMCSPVMWLTGRLPKGSDALKRLQMEGILHTDIHRKGECGAEGWPQTVTIRDTRVTKGGEVAAAQKLAMCTPFNAGRDSLVQLKVWLKFHQQLGVDHFHIYDWSGEPANNTDWQAFRQTLAPFEAKGVVTLHQLMATGDQKLGRMTNNDIMESLAHADCLFRAQNGAVEWLVNTHVDEFLLCNTPGCLHEGYLKTVLDAIPSDATIASMYELGARVIGMSGIAWNPFGNDGDIPGPGDAGFELEVASVPWTRISTCGPVPKCPSTCVDGCWGNRNRNTHVYECLKSNAMNIDQCNRFDGTWCGAASSASGPAMRPWEGFHLEGHSRMKGESSVSDPAFSCRQFDEY
jgi:hypothetical protein